jgi:hypothetical protein
VETEHERGRERPRLGGDEHRVAGDDPGLLLHLSNDGLLGGLARGDEAGEHRQAPLRPSRAPPEQQPPVVFDGHDHDGIGTREMVRTAPRAVAGVAGLGHRRARATVGTEAMAAMPVEQRDRIGGETALLRRELSAGVAQ